MCADDPHRFSNRLDEATTQRLIDRLENRAKEPVFSRLLDQYIKELRRPKSGRVLEIGCGTGATARSLARRKDFSGKIFGVDQSRAFIDAAKRFAMEDGVSGSVEFDVGDAHDLNIESESFDVVVAHTVMSHVSDPLMVLKEIARVVRKEGSIAIFDGDYASLTYAFPDHEVGRQMDRALVSVTFNNPLVMRDLVRLFPTVGLQMTKTLANVVSEIGAGRYFKSFSETYVPLVSSAGLLPKEKIEEWCTVQTNAMNTGTFFASCNYYTYLVRRA
jgi:ubiquinone/menaquinone biosynthesis C-methylase UbiE